MHIGFPGSLGARLADYFVSDRVALPPDVAQRQFRERQLILPYSYQANDHMRAYRVLPAMPTRQALGLPVDRFVFCDFNQVGAVVCLSVSLSLLLFLRSLLSVLLFVVAHSLSCWMQLYKIDEELFDAWLEILRQTPHSVLWLLRYVSLSVSFLFAILRNIVASVIVSLPSSFPSDKDIHRVMLCV
jgi:hypothetical protein